jgi:hypothetical protein
MQLAMLGILAAALLISSCAPTASTVVASAPDCRPWRAKAVVQCWWPGTGHPLTNCEISTRSQCPLDEQAVGALEGDATVILDATRFPRGTWAWFDVYQDESGRVGRASFKDDHGTILVR